MKLTSTVKGFITGILMVATGIIIYLNKMPENTPFNYIAQLLYGLGIVWSITSYAARNKAIPFKELFQQGFKCFIAATLILALYTFVYLKMNEAEIDKVVEKAKLERIKTAKDRTPAEIDNEAEQTRKYYIPFQVSIMVFSNLFTGVIVTMATAGALYLRNKKS